MKVPSVENDFKSSLKHEIKEIETPKHKNDKGQVRTASGIGITGMLGAISLEAVDLLGEHVAEIVGGGTGAGLIIFFLFKFFTIEAETITESLEP